jgi:hypothetical protein
VIEEFRRLCGAGGEFAERSVTAAVEAALRRLGLRWPKANGRAQQTGGAAEEEAGDAFDVGVPMHWHDADSEDEDEAAVDERMPDARAVRRAAAAVWRREVQCAAGAIEGRRAEFAMGRCAAVEGGAFDARSSGALWREMQPSRGFLRAVFGAARATHEVMCYGALVGGWRRAPMGHVRIEGTGEFTSGCCAACGARCADLDVHLLLGGGAGGVPRCTDARAAAVREECTERVERRLIDNGEARALAMSEPGTRARLAVMLGGMLRLPRGDYVYMRREASYALPSLFSQTWGKWSMQLERDGVSDR